MKELDQIKARAEAATPGPWERGGMDAGHSRFEVNWWITAGTHGDTICDMDGLTRSHNEVVAQDDGGADAEFIAHARTDIPRLLAALDAVLGWHQRGTRDHCIHCKHEWPCPTVADVKDALGEQ